MHWGHAVSTDGLHWEHLPIALYPDEIGMAFSGSGILLDEAGRPAQDSGKFALVYTSHGAMEQQSIAFSEDGIHFTPYEGNPVIPNATLRDFRDPKVFPDPVNGGFGLVLAAGNRAMFYHSEDLFHWEKTGEFGPFLEFAGCVWECPSIVQIGEKWVFLISMGMVGTRSLKDMYYWIGQWDGRTFTAETEMEIVDFARDDYAGVFYYGAPEPSMISWASQWAYANQVPTAEEGFRSQMTYIRALQLVETPQGLKLAAEPVGNLVPTAEVTSDKPFEITLSNGEETFRVGLNAENQVYMDRTGLKKAEWSELYNHEAFGCCRIPRLFTDRPCEMKLYVDHSVAEVYVDGGTRVGTMLLYPEKPLNQLKIEK